MRSPYLHINYDDFNIIIKKLQIILLNLLKTYILILKFSYKETDMKTVIVTGASRGIGKSIALRFAKEKVHMAITCRHNTDMLNEVKDKILKLGSDCICYTGDLSLSDNVNDLFNIIEKTYGNVDILINNAGISYIGLINTMSDKDWHNVMGSNTDSMFYCCRAAIPYMLKKHSGRIINISSVWGNYGASCEAAYSASKGAVNTFTKALAKELAPSGISVNALACGFIDTDMNNCFTDEEKQDIIQDIPAGRMGTAEEIADTVYAISCFSPYITGQIITADGGWC